MDILLQWGMKEKDAQIVIDALQRNQKIIITGTDGTGKTKLLNELIRLKPVEQHFQYRTLRDLNDYDLEVENQTRIARTLWSASFLVIDDDPDFLKRYLDYSQPILATYNLSDIKQLHHFKRHIQPFYNVVVTLNRYKEVLSVNKITIHDRLVYKSSEKYEQMNEELDAGYPFGAPAYLKRFHWLGALTPAEKAAVQFAAMNRSIENSGMSGWYQADGNVIDQDLPDLLKLSIYAYNSGISGFDFLHGWLIRVRDEYLPAIREQDSDILLSELPVAETLSRLYWAWDERFDRFDELLELLNEQTTEVI